jgi:hypothetical protein
VKPEIGGPTKNASAEHQQHIVQGKKESEIFFGL